MRTLALSLMLLFAAPFVADTAFADPVEIVVAGSGSSGAGSPHASSPIEIAQGSVTTDWDLVESYGPIWGGMLLLFALASRFARKAEEEHWVKQGRTLAVLVAGVGVLGAVLEAHFSGGTWAGVVVTLIAAVKMVWSPTVPPKKSAPPFGAIDLLMVLVVIGFVLGAAGCPQPGPGTGPAIESTVIDCTLEHRAEIDCLVTELEPLLIGGHTDWSAVYERAKHAGAAIGGCALAELVQDYLGGRKAPETDDGWKAKSTLEEFRGSVAGNATFRTRYGDL